jgi:uncharacterized protein YgiM (DUF1202 family)
MMFYLKRNWIIVLLLVLCACNTDQEEETPTPENEAAAATVENIIPTNSPAATEPTTATPTLRATASAPEPPPSQAQVRPLSNAIFIRSGPGEEFDTIALLNEDDTAILIDTNEFDTWYEIRTEDGEEGWVAASVVELTGAQIVEQSASPTPRPQITAEPGTTRLRVTINTAYVRSGPGQNYPVIDSVAGGSTVTVLAYAKNGNWFNIQLSDERSGWIGATVTEPVGGWTFEEINPAETVPAPPPTPQNNCDPAYPTVCIPSPPPDLDCRDIPYQNFTVLPPDPHLFDGNQDGIGCGT